MQHDGSAIDMRVRPDGGLIALRPMEPDDEALVYRSWLDTYSRSRWARQWSSRPFFMWLQRLIIRERIAHGRVLVACVAAAPSTILGWCCTGPGDVVHYVWIKPRARREGLAHKLLAPFIGNPCTVTCAFEEYRRETGRWEFKLPEGWRYEPYLVPERT